MKNLRGEKGFSRIKASKIIGYSLSLIFICTCIFITYVGGESNSLWIKIFDICGLSDSLVLENEDGMSVHFLDVGKADCSYIKCGDYNVLIDAADKEVRSKVTEYLKHNNVRKLDLVVSTHPHRDHIGQMSDVINNFNIDKFIMSDIPQDIIPTIYSYESMLRALKEKNVNVHTSSAGERIQLGDMIIDVLGPVKVSESINDNSLVVKVTYKSVRFLFMGDAQKDEEEDLISSGYDLSSDVLKVGHHGSQTSSTKRFLELVKPKYSVISVKNDRSKLPKQKVIDRLHDVGSKVIRTDASGNIVFITDGNNINIFEERKAS